MVWGAAFVLLVLVTPMHHPSLPHPSLPPERPAQSPHAIAQPVAGELFSRRARRRAAIMLRLRWDELRMAQLERARAAIRRQLPIDELLRSADEPKR